MRAGFQAALLAIGIVSAATSAHAALVISNAATSNVTCIGGVCSATAKKAVLNVMDLTNLLAAGDVKVTAGDDTTKIMVKSSFSWTSTSRLTLEARQSVEIEKPIMVTGIGALTVTTNNGGSGGGLIFDSKGNVRFWDLTSSLIINGNNYALVNSIKTLAAAVMSNPSGYFALASTYDASHDGVYKRCPISRLDGAMEGLGNSITRFSMKQTRKKQNAALIDTNNGVIRDLGLSKVSIEETEVASVGALVARNNGEVVAAYSDGTINGPGYVGGLVGSNFGAIAKSHSQATITGYRDLGGLAGYSEGDIRDSYASGNITATASAAMGGLVGESYGSIENSHASGTITGTDYSVAGGLAGSNQQSATIAHSYATGNVCCSSAGGGLVGGNSGKITMCFATGSASGVFDAGGLIGGSDQYGSIDRSWASGAATILISGGTTKAGGLVGVNDSPTRYSYSTGAVTGNGGYSGGLFGQTGYATSTANIQQVYATGFISVVNEGAPMGGLIGDDRLSPGNLENTHWDLDTSGINNPAQGAGSPLNDPGVTGLTDAQLKSGLPAGFDPSIWAQSASINNGYPYLIANPPPQ